MIIQNNILPAGILLSLISLSACNTDDKITENNTYAPDEILETQAREWFINEYVKGFVEGDPKFMDHYAEQVTFIDGSTVRSLTKADFGVLIDEKYVQPWIAAGWTQTALKRVSAQAMGSGSVSLDAQWYMSTESGSSATECPSPGWHYVVVNTGDHWKILTEIEAPCRP